MLKQIAIENYILIDKALIEFGEGLNVITGETGAGKSILLNALNCTFGKKGFNKQIKPGKTQMKVSSTFDISKNESTKKVLESLGIKIEDELTLSREIDENESSAGCYINGKKCTTNDLKNISETLIEIHGQHSNYSLFSPEYPLQILDEYARNKKLLEEYRTYLKSYQEKEKQLSYLVDDVKKIQEQKDYLSFVASELKNLIEPIEYENMEETLRTLETKKSLYEKVSELLEQTKKMDEALNLSETFLIQLNNLHENYTPVLSQFYELKESQKLFKESISKENVDFISDEEIDHYNNTLARLDQLKKKYSKTLPELHLLKKEIEEKLSLVENPPDKTALEKEIITLRETLTKISKELHQKRLESANEITLKLKESFKNLAMADSDVLFHIQELQNAEGEFLFNAYGFDQVDFLYRPSSMNPFKKLSSIASGGEISRISLATKSILSSFLSEYTIVFDEIDTGIGGKTALSVGKTLFDFSRSRQVIVITHLAQIAKHSDHHFLVYKELSTSHIKKLNEQEKISEISRMLFGEQAGPQKLDVAKNFIEEN